jgi:hypothetical protein
MVVDLLSDNRALVGERLLGLALFGRILEGGLLGVHIRFHGLAIVLVDFAVLGRGDFVVMLGGFDLLVLERLHDGLVMMLVLLTVDDGLFSGFVFLLDGLVLHSRGDFGLHGGVLLA